MSKLDYFSSKQKYTINTQGVAASNLMFLHVVVGIPGSVDVARMLRSSSLYWKCESKELCIRPLRVIEWAQVQPLVLEDGAYPTTDWLLKPFPNNIHLTDTQKKFNKLSGRRIIIEKAFGLLKGYWRYILKRIDNENEYK